MAIQKITVDQAADAMAMYMHFVSRDNIPKEQEEWLANSTATGARYLLIDMAKAAEEVLKQLPTGVQAELLIDDRIFQLILDYFDYSDGTETPALKGSVEEVAKLLLDDIGYVSSAPGL